MDLCMHVGVFVSFKAGEECDRSCYSC